MPSGDGMGDKPYWLQKCETLTEIILGEIRRDTVLEAEDLRMISVHLQIVYEGVLRFKAIGGDFAAMHCLQEMQRSRREMRTDG